MSEAPGASWAGTQVYGAAALHRPASMKELQRLVAGATRIRALGTRHSFNDLADSPGDLVSVAALPGGVELDRAAGVAWVPAGWRYGDVAGVLEAAGFALHNLGSLPHISVAGAVSAATHGSGVRHGNLATAVRGLELVTASGELLILDAEDPRLPGATVGLGALGIVTRVALAVEPTYRLRQDVWTGLDWETLLADPLAVLAAAYSVSVFAHWGPATTDQVWVKHRLDEGDAPEIRGAIRSAASGWSPVLAAPVADGGETTEQGGVPGPWLRRLPHFRFEGTPSAGDEIQSEWFVALADAAPALAAVRTLADRIDPLLITTELRTIAADELWLSTAYRRDSLAIHFTWRNEPEAVRPLLPRIEAALAPFAPRPHWGKWFDLRADEIAGRYERMADFHALAAELDPAGKLRNDFLRRTIGLDA